MAKNPKPITAKQREAYLACGGAVCPHCGSRDLDADSPSVSNGDDSVITCNTNCDDCGEEWVDHYRLADIEAADEFSHGDNDSYISRAECLTNRTHLASCDRDGYCDRCGEQ